MKMIEYRISILFDPKKRWTVKTVDQQLTKVFRKYGTGWLTSQHADLADGIGHWISTMVELSRNHRNKYEITIYDNNKNRLRPYSEELVGSWTILDPYVGKVRLDNVDWE